MYPIVGWGLSNITNALNPVNQLKAAWGVVSNPFNPLKQTQAVANLFRSGGGAARPPAPPPGYGAPPPGFYGGAPPGYGPPPPPPGWGGPPPPQFGGAAPPPEGLSYAPQIPPTSQQPWGGFAPPAASTPMYDPNQYLAQTAPPLQQDFGSMDTGWSAAYGDPNSGAGW